MRLYTTSNLSDYPGTTTKIVSICPVVFLEAPEQKKKKKTKCPHPNTRNTKIFQEEINQPASKEEVPAEPAMKRPKHPLKSNTGNKITTAKRSYIVPEERKLPNYSRGLNTPEPDNKIKQTAVKQEHLVPGL